MSPPDLPLPLAGVRVLSLAEQFPGPYATLLLGDLGADVVQVERPAGGDPARGFPAIYEAINRGKRSVALNLKDAAAAAACRALALASDVVLDGFRPGVLGRLGLGHDELLEARPALVYVSVSGFGQTGPYRDRPGHDLSYQALAGTLPEPPGADNPPLPALTLADLVSGLFAAVAALTGLVGSRASGRGGHYDVSMFDTLVSLLTAPLTCRLNDPDARQPGGDPGYGLFPTADGRWLALAVAYEDPYWRRICETVGLERLAGLDHQARVARRDELRLELAAVLAARPLIHWEAALGGQDVPYGAVNDLDRLLADLHFQARGLVHEVAGEHRTQRYVTQPLAVDGHRPGPRRSAPALGQHTLEVLLHAGLTDQDVAGLLARGAALSSTAPTGHTLTETNRR